MNHNEQLAEAIRRMKKLDLHENTISDLKQGVLNASENYGALYWVDDETKARVSLFEKKHNALVYHVIRSHTHLGLLLSYLYVSDSPEEWEMDREDLEGRTPLAFVENIDCPDFSEFGYIGVRPLNGGVIRTE